MDLKLLSFLCFSICSRDGLGRASHSHAEEKKIKSSEKERERELSSFSSEQRRYREEEEAAVRAVDETNQKGVIENKEGKRMNTKLAIRKTHTYI